ncbi:hypothetical protein ASE01_15860 [Nocardioides sp. Root190]|uniref:hypothetical protein n=1 Tax=Nocardioides sp. Root190 TaxID=1736488 RepID=UPI0006F9BF7D|nr:hypothetical protein [Nocardioides sp. Root190]KRB76438.1 hypothetical protein ASE01_15860 [Nocardioides sp. Root190]
MEIQQLVNALTTVLQDPVAEDDFVYGMAALPAAGTDVMVNVDPETEDRDEVPVADLVEKVRAFLAITADQWDQVLTDTIREIEEAAGSQSGLVSSALRDDIALTSSVVFVDAVLLSFVAPLQFPDGIIRVQLDENLRFEDIEVEIEGVESVSFEGLDDLLDHLGDES